MYNRSYLTGIALAEQSSLNKLKRFFVRFSCTYAVLPWWYLVNEQFETGVVVHPFCTRCFGNDSAAWVSGCGSLISRMTGISGRQVMYTLCPLL
jgi:hypothetical protein